MTKKFSYTIDIKQRLVTLYFKPSETSLEKVFGRKLCYRGMLEVETFDKMFITSLDSSQQYLKRYLKTLNISVELFSAEELNDIFNTVKINCFNQSAKETLIKIPMRPGQYTELINSYRQCLPWNNGKISKRDLNKFMSLYLKAPLWYKTDTRNYCMFWFTDVKLSSKLKHKRARIIRKYLS